MLSTGFEASARLGRDSQRRSASSARPAHRQPRERFVETAYWNPRVVTGKDGKARVTFKAPSALSEYRITARGVTGADTLVGQTTASLTVRKNFFVDLKVPSSLTQGDKPRFIAQVHHIGRRGHGRRSKLADLRRRPRRGLSQDASSSRATASTRSSSSRSRFPTATSVRLTLTGDARRADGRADRRDADPALGRSGVCLGLGHQQRRHDRLRRPAQGADLREPRDADRHLADARADAHRAGAGPRRLDPARSTANCRIMPPAAGHDGRPRRRPAGGDLGACRICARPASSGTPDAAAADRAHPGAGRRADRRPERGRRLALGQRRTAAAAGHRTSRPLCRATG